MTVATRPQRASEAAALALTFPTGSVDRIYYEGQVDGFLAAEMPGTKYAENYRVETGRHWLAQPVSSPGAAANLASLAGGKYQSANIRVMGMLAAFKDATEEWAGAEACASCDRRLFVTDEDAHECPEHGWIHDHCATVLCSAGGPCGEPEFDSDVYYQNKYGS